MNPSELVEHWKARIEIYKAAQGWASANAISKCVSELSEALKEQESETRQLKAALRTAHDQMMTWFSSEYANHPSSKQIGKILQGSKP